MSKKDTNEEIEDQDIFDLDETEASDIEQEEIEERSEVDILKEDVAKEKDKFMRLFAEFENYKKRTSKERIDLFKTAGQELMLALLPVLDDFDRAYSEISKTDEKELLKGVELIGNKLRTTLQQKGLSQIDVAIGDQFNADDHEAITQVPAPSDDLKGKIIDVIEKGYKLGDRVIRFPKVVIGQ